jgi:hypothetical protein
MSKRLLAFAFGLILGIGGLSLSFAAGSFPSVEDLQEQLPLLPGSPLPKQVMNSRTGQIFNVFYVRGHYLGNGLYEAELRLAVR